MEDGWKDTGYSSIFIITRCLLCSCSVFKGNYFSYFTETRKLLTTQNGLNHKYNIHFVYIHATINLYFHIQIIRIRNVLCFFYFSSS